MGVATSHNAAPIAFLRDPSHYTGSTPGNNLRNPLTVNVPSPLGKQTGAHHSVAGTMTGLADSRFVASVRTATVRERAGA